ncbi:hypothetical protein RRG08_037540 [Elysia crispata]|uniref:Uncharacterized protein n=1 Tax=Elysia crispata TaxID=231223 RepID=A0AAE1CT22_9GAST|nr:hypothetical protein RRG08_037540 [Elysia crispata]
MRSYGKYHIGTPAGAMVGNISSKFPSIVFYDSLTAPHIGINASSSIDWPLFLRLVKLSLPRYFAYGFCSRKLDTDESAAS